MLKRVLTQLMHRKQTLQNHTGKDTYTISTEIKLITGTDAEVRDRKVYSNQRVGSITNAKWDAYRTRWKNWS